MTTTTPRPHTSDESYLYRWFGADASLLYVGITSKPRMREVTHRSTSWWSPLAVRVEVDPRGMTRAEAEECERRAIQGEGPIFNDTHAPGRHARVRAYFVERGLDPIVMGLNAPRWLSPRSTDHGGGSDTRVVAEELAERVRQMAPGDEIGSLRTIAVGHQVTPHIARRSLAILVQRGLVRAESRRHVVADPRAPMTDSEAIADLQHRVAELERRQAEREA
jgi:DNA-binding transcriptional regulator YhcF (GntR family)